MATNKPAARPAAAPAKQAARPATAAATKPTQAPARPAATTAPKAGPTTSTAVTQRQTTAVATPRADVPEHIKQAANRGSEQVDMQDLVIPRIELAQALSKCLKEGDGAYIEGAKAGSLYNSVTRDLYGTAALVCPVYFKKQHLLWQDLNKGGGFAGAYDSMEEAQARLAEQDQPDNWEIVETAQQIVLVVDPDTYDTSEAVVSMAKTKQKVSRQWNSLIRVNGFDRFSRLYELFSADESNNAGQDYKNYGVRYVDFAPKDVYEKAEALYNSIASGERKVKLDDNYDDSTVIDAETVPPGPAQTEY